ncbi:hypothetical protein [Sulfobacillus thermosulfidooxidans]|uniref:Ferritin-like domain-containing protein n=1 Tax=Sulfobacillus thermosulfidooxidans (strain DSM 9293 / VKM B-1269 / AT-1) TaxID=929705 RepID=A0A1W1W9Z3_SULTA|nr:hypothetical protein [Sulfobacillus thermosulfidooxidans]OLZ10454.1 hypothetical protein BFX05_01040 [Sulfobacillus thermosulfidooxidans]OLZ14290.1 hypothetical protein BFX06_08380 [Sulfobacillus thermosulfidooxidans]OLZ19033.1 hypothetical protein BFX07_04775 [Sulfobacillus thermosulfidooxidans]SMC02543.1 hypothetical protein SAMN00768000_0643 [Sulfobacillus thermosulfidooxidans DSM 9293]
MIRVNPELTDEQLLRLFDKGTLGQWTPDAIDWGDMERISPEQRHAIAQILTPVYLGEQTAMFGVSAVLPDMLGHGHHEEALYLSSMGLDEARHFRNLHKLYRIFQEEPASRHRIPEMFRYHARLLSHKDSTEWIWGILISDLFAKHFYGGLYSRFPDTLVGRLARRTLRDEARHQAFSERYLEKRLPTMDEDKKGQLFILRDDLFRIMEAIGERLKDPMLTLAWEPSTFLEELFEDTERWVNRLYIAQPS